MVNVPPLAVHVNLPVVTSIEIILAIYIYHSLQAQWVFLKFPQAASKRRSLGSNRNISQKYSWHNIPVPTKVWIQSEWSRWIPNLSSRLFSDQQTNATIFAIFITLAILVIPVIPPILLIDVTDNSRWRQRLLCPTSVVCNLIFLVFGHHAVYARGYWPKSSRNGFVHGATYSRDHLALFTSRSIASFMPDPELFSIYYLSNDNSTYCHSKLIPSHIY